MQAMKLGMEMINLFWVSSYSVVTIELDGTKTMAMDDDARTHISGALLSISINLNYSMD